MALNNRTPFENKGFDDPYALANWLRAQREHYNVTITRTEIDPRSMAPYISGYMTPKVTVAALLEYAHEAVFHTGFDNNVASLVFVLAVTEEKLKFEDIRDDIVKGLKDYGIEFITAILDGFGDELTAEETKQYYEEVEGITFTKVNPSEL